jgi:hypothetical protein
MIDLCINNAITDIEVLKTNAPAGLPLQGKRPGISVS